MAWRRILWILRSLVAKQCFLGRLGSTLAKFVNLCIPKVKAYGIACLCTATKIRFMYSFFWQLSGLSPDFHIHVSVSDLYIPRIGPHISCSIIGRSIMGIYKPLTDTWMWKLGLWPRNSFSIFKFSLLVLCSVGNNFRNYGFKKRNNLFSNVPLSPLTFFPLLCLWWCVAVPFEVLSALRRALRA
jgi:hypothetical protein